MMFHAQGVGGIETDLCYYSCSLFNPNNLPGCAAQCCAANSDTTDSLCQGTLTQTPAEVSNGVIPDVIDTATGSFPGGSSAAVAATCATNPTFTCWWQQNGTTVVVLAGGLIGLFAVAEFMKAIK